MRTHIFYIAIILLLFGGLFGLLKWGQMHREESQRKGDNIEALRSDTTEKAVTIQATRKELKVLFVQKDSLIKAFEKAKGGKVREVHTVRYVVGSTVYDTVIQELPALCQMEPMQFYFPHGCLTSIVDYDPLNGVAQDSLFGEVEINRYVLSEKPRWRIVKPWYWNSKNWPVTDIRVENNCGLIIKENTIFEIK
jgi:hypothetical protein